jgi:acid stress chaperone HdeB
MTRYQLRITSLIVAFLGAAPAQAQVTVDLAKITCEQYILFKVADPQKIAIWLSGYYHGTQKTTVLDQQHFATFSDKLSDYCRGNFSMTAMQAAENLVAAENKASGR